MEPEVLVPAEIGDLLEGIHDAGRDGAAVRDDRDRAHPRLPVLGDPRAELVDPDPVILADRDLPNVVHAQAQHVGASDRDDVGLGRHVDHQ